MLQLAFTMPGAMPAVKVVVAEQHFEGGTSQRNRTGGVCADIHTIRDSLGAGGDRLWPAADFHEAKAAGSGRTGLASYAAQVGNEEPVVQRGPQQVGARPGFYRPAVYMNGAGHAQTIPNEKAGYKNVTCLIYTLRDTVI
jgi:hypothetical protein